MGNGNPKLKLGENERDLQAAIPLHKLKLEENETDFYTRNW
jgi:hypothetical protein